jgi:hypothetical protein
MACSNIVYYDPNLVVIVRHFGKIEVLKIGDGSGLE